MKTYYWLKQNRFLSHLRTSFCALAILSVPLAFPSAVAGTPPQASGTFSPCFNYVSVEFLPPGSGPLNFMTALTTFYVTVDAAGTFNGHLEGNELDVVHHSDGSINLHGSLVFTGSVGDKSGTMLFTYTGIGNLGTGHETLHWVGRQGTDGLAGIYAEGTIEGDLCQAGQPGCPGGACAVAGAGTYTGQILFAPPPK
jgi:Protein of unknown function (DUF3224)